MKRETRSRLQWFAFDVDAFLDDPRMMQLSIREKSAWAMMLIRAFRNGGTINTNPAIVSESTALSNKDARALLAKLYDAKLILPTEEIFTAVSPRMKKEFDLATAAYQQRIDAGKKRAETANRDEKGKLISPAVAGSGAPPVAPADIDLD